MFIKNTCSKLSHAHDFIYSRFTTRERDMIILEYLKKVRLREVE